MSVCGCVIPSLNCSCRSYMGVQVTEDVFPKGKLAALDPAQYWEAKASMWHENYKEAAQYEMTAKRLVEVLETMATGRYTAERCRQMAIKALAREKKYD